MMSFLIANVSLHVFNLRLAYREAPVLHLPIETVPRLPVRPRLVAAFLGGRAMGVGAVVARGCTSGQALTGGARLSAGSWIFMIAAFAAAYLIAPLIRRAWT